jgi:hypothetical protein
MAAMRRRTLLSLATLPLPLLGGSGRAKAPEQVLDLHGSRAILVSDGGETGITPMLAPWMRKSADAVFAYYGKFPVPEVAIGVAIVDGSGVKGGRTEPGDVPNIMMRVGAATTEAQLMRADWVMVHEMIHTAFPWMNGDHNWMAEAIAVYVESIARVQAGHLAAERIWTDFLRDMPKGLPREGDSGIDMTDTWARTYWGGALFCLVADCEIRRQTDLRFGLQHALRGINRERDFRRRWPLRETLEIGDRATGRTVLTDLYEAWRETPVTPDLAAMWAQLGIEPAGQTVTFDGGAPEAKLRAILTAPSAA